ncbi:hypothetical protein MHY86_09830 [Aerococcus urinaeequi]|uniref:hypothetical protein n=1 Tax=Aerococcus urinaeequi TaxID=51665 RepID=UPI0022818FA0|nr:hypothetical protein [Aerococcus urinaeequi]MCY7731982.1 hypothetical protein [Aerococcus urinaeequi]
MKTTKLFYDWVLTHKDDDNIVISTNEHGMVVVTYVSKEFGDIQSLVLYINGDKITIKNLPFALENLSILSDKKEINIEFISN